MEISEIISLFIKNWSNKEELYLKLGTASEINEDDFTFKFTPIDEKSVVEDVRMKVIVDSGPEAFIIIPKEGTQVVVGFHSNTVGQCLVVKEAAKILINSSSKTINIENDFNINCNDVNVSTESWDFNNGTFEGLIKINDLTTKLNALISEVNSFKNKFNTHKHLGVRTGSGVSGVKDVTNVNNLTNFVKTAYENPIIKH